MLRVYNCIVQEHDLRLVVLAAIVCLLASFTAINLVHHVRRSAGHMQKVWLSVAAAATGFGIWATHFIAMLAFAPGIPSGYNITLTLLSLIAAIVLTGIGLGVALSRTLPGGAWLGGAIVGGGIATMHYTGMAAFEVQGRIVWDPVLVTASIAAGALIGAAATRVGLIEGERKWKFTARCCSPPPFAATISPRWARPRSYPTSGSSFPKRPFRPAGSPSPLRWPAWRSCSSPLRACPRHTRPPQAGAGGRRMRGLANAAVEGLVVCDGETIATANLSFASLTGVAEQNIAGTRLSAFLPDESTRAHVAPGAELLGLGLQLLVGEALQVGLERVDVVGDPPEPFHQLRLTGAEQTVQERHGSTSFTLHGQGAAHDDAADPG